MVTVKHNGAKRHRKRSERDIFPFVRLSGSMRRGDAKRKIMQNHAEFSCRIIMKEKADELY